MSFLERLKDYIQEPSIENKEKVFTKKDRRKSIALGQYPVPFMCRSCGTFINKTNTSIYHYNKLCKKKCKKITTLINQTSIRQPEVILKIKQETRKTKQIEKKNLNDPYRMFYYSNEWRRIRFQVIIKYGRKCMACGEIKGRIHVDHIIPRSKNRSLELDFNNLQILCESCNLGKSNLDQTDFRPKEQI